MPQPKPAKVVVAVDFAPPRPGGRRHGRLLALGLAAIVALAAGGALVTQLLLR